MGNWKAIAPDWSLDDDVRRRFEAVEKLVKGAVLDVGCRGGEFLLGLEPEPRMAVGIDIDSKYVAAANHAARDREAFSFIEEDITRIDPSAVGTFDTVVCMETLEHLTGDWHPVLEKLYGAVAAGGRLVVTVPANTHISDPDHKTTFFREGLIHELPDLKWVPGMPHIWIGFYLDRGG